MKIRLSIFLLASLLICNSASAQQFSTPFMAGSTVKITLRAGESYTCQTNGSGAYTLSLNVLGPSSESITAIYPEANVKNLEAGFSSARTFGDANLGDNLISFVATDGSAGFGEYTFTMASAAAMSANPYLFCVSTALVCNFNTILNQFAFLENTNFGSKTAPISFRTVDFSANAAVNSATVAPSRRSDIDIHSIVGASTYGSIVVRPLIASRFGETMRIRLSQYIGGVLTDTQICRPVQNFGVQ